MSRRLAAMLLSLLSVTAPCHGQSLVTEVIAVHYRSAGELVPILKPLVPAPGSVSGMLDQLVIRTTEDNLLAIKDVLAQLDMAPRNLVISVKRDSLENLHRSGGELRGQISSGDVRLSTGRRYARDGASLRLYDTEHENRHHSSQQVQVLEGHEAFIQAGRSVPLGQRSVWRGPAGTVVQDSVQYRDVTSGFYATPSVNGDQVTLRISQHSSRLSRAGGGAIDVQSADTVVSGRLGEWIRVGGAADQGAYAGRGTLYSTDHDHASQQVILLKVEERR